jgi:hypothetical protein
MYAKLAVVEYTRKQDRPAILAEDQIGMKDNDAHCRDASQDLHRL